MANDYLKGCGNHGCVIEAPVGMATNGGCRCFGNVPNDEEMRELRRRALVLATERRRLQAKVAELTVAHDKLEQHLHDKIVYVHDLIGEREKWRKLALSRSPTIGDPRRRHRRRLPKQRQGSERK